MSANVSFTFPYIEHNFGERSIEPLFAMTTYNIEIAEPYDRIRGMQERVIGLTRSRQTNSSEKGCSPSP
jgi:hypothetical protein